MKRKQLICTLLLLFAALNGCGGEQLKPPTIGLSGNTQTKLQIEQNQAGHAAVGLPASLPPNIASRLEFLGHRPAGRVSKLSSDPHELEGGSSRTLIPDSDCGCGKTGLNSIGAPMPVPSGEASRLQGQGIWRIRLDQPEHPRSAQLIGGDTIELAAQAYALVHGEFGPTIGDLLRDGWLPYSLYSDEDLNTQPLSSDGPLYLYSKDFDIDMKSSDFIINMKNRIIHHWHEIIIHEKDNYNNHLNDKFWINPLSGAAAVLSSRKGDLRVKDNDIIDQSFRIFNALDLDTIIIDTDRHVSVINCCFIKIEHRIFYASDVYEKCFYCDCTTSGDNGYKCCVKWSYLANTTREEAIDSYVADCNHSPPYGYEKYYHNECESLFWYTNGISLDHLNKTCTVTACLLHSPRPCLADYYASNLYNNVLNGVEFEYSQICCSVIVPV